MNADMRDQEEEDPTTTDHPGYKKNNVLPLTNERTMNLNPLVLTNIQSSHYFKTTLYTMKTYHEVLDEIYYKIQHLEPWEKGSRKTSGQTGMCGGVRGVGAGGIVSTAYCLLYKLFTLKLTRKQLNGMINHTDSPYIRALGFMYIRYTQPPADLWTWYEPYLEDEEELDVKAGGGQVMTIGNMLRSFLTKLEWHGTLFPRIPVPIQQKLEKQMSAKFPPVYSQAGGGYYNKPGGNSYGGNSYNRQGQAGRDTKEARHIPDSEAFYGEAERQAKFSDRGSSRDQDSRYGKERARGYESNDRYKSSGSRDSRYGSPERKKYREDTRDRYTSSSKRDKYSSSRDDRYTKDDKYNSSKDDRYTKEDKYKDDKYSSNKDDRYTKEDKYKDDKYSSSKDDRYTKEDKYKDDRYSRDDRYSSRDKYSDRSSRHNHDRDRSRSPKHHRRH